MRVTQRKLGWLLWAVKARKTLRKGDTMGFLMDNHGGEHIRRICKGDTSGRDTPLANAMVQERLREVGRRLTKRTQKYLKPTGSWFGGLGRGNRQRQPDTQTDRVKDD